MRKNRFFPGKRSFVGKEAQNKNRFLSVYLTKVGVNKR